MLKIALTAAGIALLALLSATAHGEWVRFTVDEADGRTFDGELHLPDKRPGPAPVVVMLPGTAGVDQRQEFYRSHLLAAGIGTFVVDIKSGVFTTRHDRPKSTYFIPVGYQAIRLLRHRPDVDRQRIGVMGWSFGGAIALRVAHQRYARRWLRSDEPGFAAHVGIYGGCTRSRRVRLRDVPILIVIGTADTITDPGRCKTFRELHPDVTVIFLEDAHHGFDKEGESANRRGRIMWWSREAAEYSREHVVAFFKKALLPAGR